MLNRVLDFVAAVAANPGKALRSALTTALAVVAVLAVVQQAGVSVPANVTAAVTLAVSVLRTLIAAVDSRQTLYGRGSA